MGRPIIVKRISTSSPKRQVISRLMNGQIQILTWEGRRSLYVRLYDQANKKYVVRSLRTDDIGQATDKAIAIWREVQPKIEQGHPTDKQTLASCVALYLEEEAKRVEAELILKGNLRDKTTQLKTMLIYCSLNSLNYITQVKEHSFNNFIAWRRDESLLLTTGKRGQMELASVNKSIREVRAFFKWIRKKRLSTVELEMMEVVSRKEKIRKKNIVFTDDDNALIEDELLRRTKVVEGERRELLPIQLYARHLLKSLIQTLINSGLRPQEATNLLKWKDIEFKGEGRTAYDKAMDTTCVINVINPRGKGSRGCISDAGLILKLWKIECDKFRKIVGLHALQKDMLVFGNPLTGQPYSYSGLGNQFREVLKDLGLDGKGYTIRSCRGYYITKLLAKGHPPYLVAKNCGHSVKIMETNYEQMTVSDLLEEFG